MRYQKSYIVIYAKGILQKNPQTITQKDNEDKMIQFKCRSPRQAPSRSFSKSRQMVLAAVLLPWLSLKSG